MDDNEKKHSKLKNKFKTADKPRKAEKAYVPPGIKAKMAGMVVFWLLLGFMFLVVFSTLIQRNMADAPAEVEEIEQNPATNVAGVEFAKRFAEMYFTWEPTGEGWDKRAADLAPMMPADLDEQAGLLIADQEWTSTLESASLIGLEEDGESRALVTLEVNQKLTKPGEDETDPNEIQFATHIFTVPVGFQDGFGVYDLPSFTAVADTAELESDRLSGEVVEAEVEAAVRDFLPTFFQSYANDLPDKLAYVLDTGEAVKGLEGTKEFVEVRDATIVTGEAAGTFKVAASVILEDPATDSGYLTNYRLEIGQSEGRYVVTKLNEGVE